MDEFEVEKAEPGCKVVYLRDHYLLYSTVYTGSSKYKKVGVLPIRIVWSNVSSIGPSSERNRK